MPLQRRCRAGLNSAVESMKRAAELAVTWVLFLTPGRFFSRGKKPKKKRGVRPLAELCA